MFTWQDNRCELPPTPLADPAPPPSPCDRRCTIPYQDLSRFTSLGNRSLRNLGYPYIPVTWSTLPARTWGTRPTLALPVVPQVGGGAHPPVRIGETPACFCLWAIQMARHPIGWKNFVSDMSLAPFENPHSPSDSATPHQRVKAPLGPRAG